MKNNMKNIVGRLRKIQSKAKLISRNDPVEKRFHSLAALFAELIDEATIVLSMQESLIKKLS